MTTKTQISTSSEEIVSDWFENLIGDIRVDQLQIQTGTANPEKSKFYELAMAGDTDGILKSLRKDTNQHFINIIVKNFMFEITNKKALPKKLAFSLSPSTILVWVEIADNDENTEDEILLAESRVNSLAKNYDFNLDTMIVEESDKINIPPHYISVNLSK